MNAPSRVRVFIGEPSSIDPAHGFEHDGALILRFLADPLLDFDASTGEPRPAAAGRWEVADDGMSVDFWLRKDVKFHSGRVVTADDYVYSLSRVAQPSTASKLAYNLTCIEGFEEVRAGTTQTLSGVQAIEPFRLRVRLRYPFFEIAGLFGHRVTSAVPRELVEGDPERFRTHPVSTGPYRVAEDWQAGRGVLLERAEGYYAANGAFADGGSGHLDELEFCIYEELEQAYDDWFAGRMDVVKVPPSRIPDALPLGEQFRRTPCALMQYIGFPTEVPPFDDPLVRRAVAMTIDRQALIDEHFSGTRPIANRILPPAFQTDDSDLVDLAFDPEQARELLRQHRIDPVTTGFAFNAGLGHDHWVTALIDQVNSALGWRISPRPMEWTDFLRWLPHADSLFRMTWAIDYPSVDNFLYPLFHSASVGDDNFTRYQSPAVDRYIDAARATADAEERGRLYRDAETTVCADLPLVPLWFGVQYHLVNLKRFQVQGPVVDLFGEPVLRQFAVRPPGPTSPDEVSR